VLRAVASAAAFSMRKVSLPSIAANTIAPITPSAADSVAVELRYELRYDQGRG
jgi:hypothetical protein